MNQLHLSPESQFIKSVRIVVSQGENVCTFSQPELFSLARMLFKVVHKLDFLFIRFLLDLLGLGLKGQNIGHWLLLAFGCVHRIILILSCLMTFTFELRYISSTLSCVNSCLTFFVAMKKLKETRSMSLFAEKLCKNNLFLVKSVDLTLFLIILYQLTVDLVQADLFDCVSTHIFDEIGWDGDSTAWQVAFAAICVHEAIVIKTVDILCALYILVFLIVYFIKIQHLAALTSIESSGWKEKVLAILVHVSGLNQKLESSLSFILFFRAVRQFVHILIFLYEALYTSQAKIQIRWQVGDLYFFEAVAEIILTVLLFLSISLMQEHLEGQIDDFCKQIAYSGLLKGSLNENLAVGGIISAELGKRVTIWKFLEVSRSILLTLASAYVAFPVLLWQINNGGLGQLNLHNDTSKEE